MRTASALLVLALVAPFLPGQLVPLTLSVTQPGGSGTLDIQVGGAVPDVEIFVIVSLHPYVPTGSGPLLGLSLESFGMVVDQLLLPLGAAPFHVLADALGEYHFSYVGGPGVTPFAVDVVAISYEPLVGLTGISPVLAPNLIF